MESNGIPGGRFPGMIGLEMSLHHHRQPPPPSRPNPQNPNNNNQLQQNDAMVAFGTQQTLKQQGNINPFAQKSRTHHLLTFSDEDDDEDDPEPAGPTADDGKASPWHRMKWTDEMVRLLITVVFFAGDDGVGSEGNDPHAAAAARKKAAGAVLQKKGKWKSVSVAMMEKGYYVSPQQCEDKFNDLNKRYKRVNELLGKGTACKVVENQSLLEGMGHLSSKMKEEVKKLLNSKHLYFREMCAFHNTCGGSAQAVSVEVAAESSQPSRQKKGCLHLPESTSNHVPNLSRTETKGSKMVLEGSDEKEEDDDEEVVEGGAHDSHEYDTDDKTRRKKARKETIFELESPLVEEFSTELKNVEEDGTKSVWEKRQWMRRRVMQLEEQRLKYQCQSFELEKERMKWLKFSSNKEKEIEVEKLGNERMKLENERMLLFLRQKEQELHGLQNNK